MKKRVALFVLTLLLISLFSFPLLVAQDNESEADDSADDSTSADLSGFEAAYQCLEDLVLERGYASLTPEEISFAILALGYDSGIQGELRSALADTSYNNMCWPSDDCTVKDTARALIALEHINQPTNTIENWLMEKTTEPSELVWYLQIDTNEESDCTIAHEGGSRKVTIEEDKSITGVGGDCLSSAYNGYWMEIDENCYAEDLEISCDKDFISSLTYKKKSGSSLDAPYYVSSVTHSAPAQGKTKEKVESLCFKREDDSSSCDYESSLWATLALKKLGKDTTAYIPYLIALASSNDQYLPSAFLYMLTGDDEYFVQLINEQYSEGYWQTTSDQNKRYYDTALGLLALQGRSAEQAQAAKDWLLETQQTSGCWRNARDTAFALYAAAPKDPVVSADRASCTGADYFCVSSEEDCENAIGVVQSGYYCSSLGQSVCCTVKVQEDLPDAESLGGVDDNECEERGYYCKAFCDDDVEELKPYSCSGIQDCCAPKTAEAGGGGGAWWIWLLIILIILLILAIIFRNQVKVWVFRVKNKFKKGPVAQQRRPGPGRPGAGRPGIRPMRLLPRKMLPPGARRPGRPPMRMPARRPAARPGPGRPGAHRPFPKEDALQKTLKKLRDMGR